MVVDNGLKYVDQGVPNLLALKTFVEHIMERPGGFSGEVVVAENCHRGSKPWQSDVLMRSSVINHFRVVRTFRS